MKGLSGFGVFGVIGFYNPKNLRARRLEGRRFSFGDSTIKPL